MIQYQRQYLIAMKEEEVIIKMIKLLVLYQHQYIQATKEEEVIIKMIKLLVFIPTNDITKQWKRISNL